MKIYPAWENFKASFTQANGNHVLHGNPNVLLVWTKYGEEFKAIISLNFAVSNEMRSMLPTSDALAFSLETSGAQNGELHITNNKSWLNKYFYRFLLDCVHLIQNENSPVFPAIEKVFSDWSEILSDSNAKISVEKYVGLFGELKVLQLLIERYGSQMIKCWEGAKSDAHDFRIGKYELEVKSTRSVRAIHTISSLEQLEISAGFHLYLISVRLKSDGFGESLHDLIGKIRMNFRGNSDEEKLFERSLLRYPYSSTSDSLSESLKFSNPPNITFSKIDDDFPAVTRSMLLKLKNPNLVARIESLKYSIALDGMLSPFQDLLNLLESENEK